MNCLNQAISEERIHQVRLLLSMNVSSDVRDKNDHDRTPLIKCSLVKSEDSALKLLKILLKFGVSINAVDSFGRSALQYACETGKAAFAKVLMNEDGIELNTQDNEGKTALMLACANGHLVMARILMGKLIKFDLEIDLRDNQSYTALLLAIKNEHYDVAHDLVRYANACITLRDSERFMNAAEWLKANLELRRKSKVEIGNKKSSETRDKRSKTSPEGKTADEKETGERDAEDAPILTESQEIVDFDENEDESTGRKRIGTATSSLLLFGPDPYSNSMRPPSSGASISRASSVGTSRFSASSRNRQTRKMEHLREEQNSATPSARVHNPAVENLKKETSVDSVTLRSSRKTWRGDDLESIIEDPLSRQPSRSGGRDSVAGKQSPGVQQDSKTNAKTPVSVQASTPYHQTARLIRSEKLKQEKSSEIYSIQKLKQALRDKTRRKITRASTAVFRPVSGAPSEQWMSSIIKGATGKRVHTLQPTFRPSTQQATRVNQAESMISDSVSRKLSVSQIRDSSQALKLLHAASNLSLDTLLSQSDMTESTMLYPVMITPKKSDHSRQLSTLFRLYTDSCLWKPEPIKPPSLAVQVNTENSERMTLRSELSESTNDFGSIVERPEGHIGSAASSIQPRTRPESKTAQRNRIASSTSRISKTGRGADSASARSTISRNAD